MAYKQKVRIFEMPPIQVLVYKIKASFVPNSKSLPRLAQFYVYPLYYNLQFLIIHDAAYQL